MIYDVVVIGAGSNGATAAHFLAKRGFSTVLLEMSGEPGEKCHGATEYAPVPFHGKSRPSILQEELKGGTVYSSRRNFYQN